ncbi:MAG: HAMP domain-containing sensor histidine kinase [Chloroflexota bacterium]
MAVRERVTELEMAPANRPAALAGDEALSERERVLRQMLESEIQKRTGFVRALVHELKTPLTAVLASSDLMTTGLRQEPWLSLARNIHKGAINLNRRIDELLDLARGETGLLTLKPQMVNPRQLLYQIAGEMSPLASQQRKTLRLELPSSLPVVQADEARLRQVILNLLSNALKFTLRDGEIELGCQESPGCLVFTVTDQGPGITEAVQKRLFEPYQRWEDDAEILSGLRLGLALSKMLVELHGGKIWVKSRPGSGSTFGFSLPAG